MAIYVPTANNWHYVHFPVIGYVLMFIIVFNPPLLDTYLILMIMFNPGIVRDDKGRWLGGFVGRLGVVTMSCLTAELWAIHGGMTVAKNFNLKNVIFETDSRESLMLMSKGRAVNNHLDHDVIEECRRLLSELGISMMHTLREGNRCADHLAKLGRMQLNEDLVILHRPPHSIHQLLLADMAHVAYHRYRKHVR
ncbi:hypothetical protein R3W88_026184 [Solanum pinnatisectum]|uniref:RNase H type-1 domain-containing protein n=1 Tax=Solanum pinnatisectum TaxID=50273 RepID=A0AAV9LF26_9SOLN|nr:hypothetical protein R3W88_026184 [Solanum pinnatisectum]